jgi:hypothetical protein
MTKIPKLVDVSGLRYQVTFTTDKGVVNVQEMVDYQSNTKL